MISTTHHPLPATRFSHAWSSIFWFEIRYHLRQPLFYLITFFLSVLLFISGTGHVPGAATGRLHLNAPTVILGLFVQGIFLILFLMTAFVASAAVRDFDRRTFEMFFSKPISRFDYLTGRFAGAVVVCSLAYFVGAAALAVSAFMPWIDPARLGPFQFAPYAFGLGVLVFPTLLALGAVFFALASWTRGALATYVAVVAFFAINALAGIAAFRLWAPWIGQLLDPFGIVALQGAMKYWTVVEQNTATPELGGILLWNRIFWLGIGFSALGLAVVKYQLRSRKCLDSPDATDSVSPVNAIPFAAGVRAPATRREFGAHAILIQFLSQVRRETSTVVKSLPFLVIIALGLAVLISDAPSAGNVNGMPVYPRTYLMVQALQGLYSVVLLLVVVLYSGEVIWKERTLEMEEIHDSMPTLTAVYFGAKLTALLLVIVVYLVTGVLALIGFQLWSGYTSFELGVYAQGAAVAAVYPILILALACICHSVTRNRLVGYGLVLLFIFTWDVLESYGFEHHLYRFASLPPMPYSDFNGYGPFGASFAWFSLYWGLAALVLGGLSILFWKRGTDQAWRMRWAEARARFRGSVRAVTVLGAVGFAATGGWIFYNTNIVNEYLPSTLAADSQAVYERLYRQYQGLELPRVIGVRADVSIFPDRRRVEIRGSYRLRNRSGGDLYDIHVSIPERVQVNRLELPPHDVILDDTARGYRIVRLRKPLAPGEVIDFGFDLTAENRGFVNNGAKVAVIDNGTYFTKGDFFPLIGYDAKRQLADPEQRRLHELPVLRYASTDDLAARRTTASVTDADSVEFETTVSTSSDQIAVTSGELQREWVKDGRRYFHYRAEVPIRNYFAFASARYAVTRSDFDGIQIEIYHHPGHKANIARMIDASRKSLAYYTTNFGPYKRRTLRIVEFPNYAPDDATSYPGVVGWSERLGFNARLDGKQGIDFPFYLAAHEIAHQWWGHQLIGADVLGIGVLHETLANYSALMVMEREVGRENLRRVLGYELDRYLRARGKERGVEPSLAFTARQGFVYYHKGALAMYALRDAMGEERLNAALSEFLASFATGGPPYATVVEFLPAIRQAVPAESAYLVGDLFESITTFNNKVTAATVTERADHTFLVRVEMEINKLRADDSGTEQKIPIDDWIDIAVFGEGEVGDRTMLSFERRSVSTSRAVFEIAVDRRPAWVTLDPYFKLVDRDRGDYGRAVSADIPGGS